MCRRACARIVSILFIVLFTFFFWVHQEEEELNGTIQCMCNKIIKRNKLFYDLAIFNCEIPECTSTCACARACIRSGIALIFYNSFSYKRKRVQADYKDRNRVIPDLYYIKNGLIITLCMWVSVHSSNGCLNKACKMNEECRQNFIIIINIVVIVTRLGESENERWACASASARAQPC